MDIMERNSLCDILYKLYITNKKAFNSVIRTALVEQRYINIQEYAIILRDFENNRINEINVKYLVRIVEQLIKDKIDIFKGVNIKDFFIPEELELSVLDIKKRKDYIFPIEFHNVEVLSNKKEYLIILSAQEISTLEQSGVIKIIKGMQRETEVTEFGGNIVSHVKFNKDATQEIAQLISNGGYYPTTLRWHLLENDIYFAEYEYNNKSRKLTIHDGIIAEIDGQHRSTAIVLALINNPYIDIKFPIILTIGNEEVAQNIINQDEKRQPIDKEQLIVYGNNPSNKILKEVKKRLENSLWKFYVRTEEYKKRIGFIGESGFIKILDGLDTFNDLSMEEIKKWTVDFVEIFKSMEYCIEKYTELFKKRKKMIGEVPFFFVSPTGTPNFVVFLICLCLLKNKDKDKFLQVMDSENLTSIMIEVISYYNYKATQNQYYNTISSRTTEVLNKENINVKFKYNKFKKIITVEVDNDR